MVEFIICHNGEIYKIHNEKQLDDGISPVNKKRFLRAKPHHW